MVRAVQFDGLVDLVDQVQPVLRQKRQDGIEPLLQVALGENQAVK